MKRILLIIFCLVAAFNVAYSQTCKNVKGKGGTLFTDSECVPVKAFFDPAFTLDVDVDPANVKIQINWGDGTIDAPEVTQKEWDPIKKMWKYYLDVKIHEYKDGSQCNYDVIASPVINGVLCDEKFGGPVTVWDTDNKNGGIILINPEYVQACPGQEFTIQFRDNSHFNCVPPEENDKKNMFTRWTRFTYGTVQGNTTSPRIADIKVDGTVRSYPYKEPSVKEHTYIDGVNEIISPDHISLPVTVPATAQVGEIFEIKLENWNLCNPYDPADESNAVYTYAYIEIVAPPVPAITAPDDVCPNEVVALKGASNISNVEYKWEVYENEFGTGTPVKWTGKNFDFSGFTSAGKKLVKLNVRRKGTTVDCWSDVTKIINVYNAPTVTAKINDVEQNSLDICFDPASPSSLVQYSHDLLSENGYTYQYKTFLPNSTSTTPDGPDGPGGTVPAGTAFTASYDATYSEPGQYRIQLIAIDSKTNCKRQVESVTTIYSKPDVDFSAPALCEGQSTQFKNLSSLSTAINGDVITGHEWDFGDGTAKSTEKEPNHTYADGNTYKVKLTVTTKGGCPVTLEKDIVVNKVPQAKLAYTYSGPICPGDVEFENFSRAVNDLDFGDGGVTYKIVWSDGVEVKVGSFEATKRTITFNNYTNAEITYTVWLKAVAAGSSCEMLSDPLEVKVKPGAKAGFNDPAYSVFDNNCSPVALNLEVDQATLDINGESHRWVIYQDSNPTPVFDQKYDPSHERYSLFSFDAVNESTNAIIYEVHLLVEKAGKCVQNAVQKYRVNPRPVVDFSADVTTDCDFTFVHVKVNSLTGVKNEMDWQISPEPLNKNEITYNEDFTLKYERPNINDPNAVDVSLSLNQENYFNCWQADPLVKVVKNNPKVIEEVKLKLVSDQTEGCSPLEVRFENATGQAPADTKYELYVKHGVEETKVDHLNSPDFRGDLKGEFYYTFKVPGVYTISLKATVEGSCELFSPSSVPLVINDFPKPYFDLLKKDGCSPFVTGVKDNIQNSASNQWIITDLSNNAEVLNSPDLSAVESFIFQTGTTVKEYEVKLIAESSKGCKADSTIKVKVLPGPVADFDLLADKLCSPYKVEVKNNSLASNPTGTTYTWDWSDGSTTTSSEESLTKDYVLNISSPVMRNITLTATTPEGCTISQTKTVELQPQVKASFTSNLTRGCSPLTLYLYDNSQGGDTYLWEITEKGSSAPAIFTSTLANPNNDLPLLENNGNAEKVYVVKLRLENSATSCSSTHSIEVTVLPGTRAEFGMDVASNICSETEVNFTNLNMQPDTRYVWNWGDGEPNDTTYFNEQPAPHTFYNPSTSRSKQFIVTMTAFSAVSDCSHKTSQSVWVNPAMKVVVTPNKEQGCAPLEVAFANRSENVSTHEWYYRLKGTNEREDVRTEREVLFALPNKTTDILEYEVVYNATSSTGCTASIINIIKVYPEANPQFSTDVSELTQPNSTFQITNETAEVAAWTYHWDFGDGQSATVYNPGSHTYATYGVYRITLTVWNGLCSEKVFRDVTIFETTPVVDFESIPVEGCWPLVVNFVNKSKFVDPNTFKWDFGDGEGEATSANPSYTYHKPGQYTVTLTARNSTGQAVTTQHAIVNVYERPRISFELRETEIFVPGDPLYVANYTVGADYYLWDFGDGTTYEEFEPVHYYKEPGEYTITLIARNQWGCADTLVKENVVSAKAGGKLKIPNAFTPSLGGSVGGDISNGKNNDVFFPILDGGVSKYNLKIYNRWGELLFESNRREIGWDGYFKGQLCKSDVYVFKLTVEFSDGKTLDKLGDVTLIR